MVRLAVEVLPATDVTQMNRASRLAGGNVGHQGIAILNRLAVHGRNDVARLSVRPDRQDRAGLPALTRTPDLNP